MLSLRVRLQPEEAISYICKLLKLLDCFVVTLLAMTLKILIMSCNFN